MQRRFIWTNGQKAMFLKTCNFQINIRRSDFLHSDGGKKQGYLTGLPCLKFELLRVAAFYYALQFDILSRSQLMMYQRRKWCVFYIIPIW